MNVALAEVTERQLARSLALLGDAGRLRRKLRAALPITLSAIGASNVVRGGCSEAGSSCSKPQYTNRSTDGLPRGWLLRAFESINRSWPHPASRLVNRGKMATPPSGYTECLNRYVPLDADVVLIGFAELCFRKGAWNYQKIQRLTELERLRVLLADSLEGQLRSEFFASVETVIRDLRAREDPPAIVLFNIFRWSCASEGAPNGGYCPFERNCDAAFMELAQYYQASVISLRNALWHDAEPNRGSHRYPRWTSDDGLHLDLGQGDVMAARMLHHWVTTVSETDRPDAGPATSGPWLTNSTASNALQRKRSQYHRFRVRMPRSGGHAQVAAVCFDFGDAQSGWSNPPRVLHAHDWQFVRLDAGASEGRQTLKEKPGMRAVHKGATLLLDTTRHGSRQLRLGFLQTYSSRAMARLSCTPPCTCAVTEVSAHADSRTSLTAYTNVPGGFASPPDRTCKVRLDLVSTGGPNSTGFKVTALHVS
jgi:hypothetical protein